jgi:glycine/D-amino acid oxidase-like deaminating enzyme
VRDGDLPTEVVDTGETYDLVVVGAGIAGLASAYLYYQEAPGEPSVLLLDNHEDFGGHARRNVMEYEGQRLIAPGGTFALEDVEDSPEEAVDFFRRIGLDPARLVEYRDPTFRERFGLPGGGIRLESLRRPQDHLGQPLERDSVPAVLRPVPVERVRAKRARRALYHAEKLSSRRL